MERIKALVGTKLNEVFSFQTTLSDVPRLPRIDIPGLVYHVTSRGNRRLPLFYADEDRRQFLRHLSQTKDEFPFTLHAYCLMTNHYHLLIQTSAHSLSKTMQYFKSIFAMWFNRKYGHTGHLFQGRFHSIPVDTDAYFTTVARYIHPQKCANRVIPGHSIF